ncbi:MAG: hypothetical protein OEZ58_08865 [Gammaproteobacteria bacterium]|nr:hypothetical protein [Gammaproteobacteria bacterium]MDH5729088.1 hypothetical protein [Gammaproteobacteria bacterium]
MRSLYTLIFSGSIALLQACAEGTATATVEFANTATIAAKSSADSSIALSQNPASGNTTPEYFGIKLLGVYLSESIDSNGGNTGKTSMIYVHPECNGDLNGCDVKSGAGISRIVESFFDFSRPTVEVNAVLNSQGLEITEGIYRYVRIEWCKYSDGVDTIKFRAAGMAADTYEFLNWGGCAVAVEMSTPLELKDGDSVTVTLSYDLTNTIQESNGQCSIGETGCYSYMNIDQSIRGTLLTYDIDFIPSASKN